MKKFIWDNSYSVEVEELDKQHQQFFETTNGIFENLEKKPVAANDIIFRITELGNYALYHLSTEEKYFKLFNYDEAEPHIAEHNRFREKTISYLDSIRKPGANVETLAYEIAGFATDWLVNHIPDFDKKYIQCFHDHGLK